MARRAAWFPVVAAMAWDAGSEVQPAGSRWTEFFLVAVCCRLRGGRHYPHTNRSVSTSTSGTMANSYLLGTGFSLDIEKHCDSRKKPGHRGVALAIGMGMGILNEGGFTALMLALKDGPLSAIALINGPHFVIAIVLSVLLYKEWPALTRSVGIDLTQLSIVLLR